MRLCESLDLRWKKELWFTQLHRVFRAGGICVEIEKILRAVRRMITTRRCSRQFFVPVTQFRRDPRYW